MSFMNVKVSLLKKDIILVLDLSSSIIFTIRSMNALFVNINKTVLIVDVNHVSLIIFLVIM